MIDPVSQPPADLAAFTMDGVAYEARETTFAAIKGLLAECKVVGPDLKYVELEKAKGATFKPIVPAKTTRPKFKVKAKGK